MSEQQRCELAYVLRTATNRWPSQTAVARDPRRGANTLPQLGRPGGNRAIVRTFGRVTNRRRCRFRAP